MPIAKLHAAVAPLLLGLVVGAGAVATYAVSPGAATAASASSESESAPVVTASASEASGATCADQTWPYIDRACIATDRAKRDVRVVIAPRPDEKFDARWNAGALPPAFPGMTTHDGVLRGPQHVIDPNETAAAPQPAPKRASKTATRKRYDRAARRTYTVEAEDTGTYRRVYVVSPQRIEFLQ